MGSPRLRRNFAISAALTLLLAALGLAVMGYHPGTEDDGVYLSAVKSNLNPALYPHDAAFFRLQLQATVFDKLLAGFMRATGMPVATAAFFWQCVTLVAIIAACLGIARRLFPEPRAHWAGVALVAGLFTLPVAGTALYLVDQHLHPRNVATALILIAVGRVLAGRRWQAAVLLLAAFAIHPIMAAMGISFCVFLALSLSDAVQRRLASAPGSLAAFVPLGWVFEPPTPIWRRALATRRYYFLFHWTWYEWLGALAPLALFWLLVRWARQGGRSLLSRFALAVLAYGLFQQTVAMVLLGVPALERLIPLQPMRFLQLVYFFLVLIFGCLAGEFLLKTRVLRWAVFLIAVNAGMFAAQRAQFPASQHLEFPSRVSANPWLQAFAWIRQNTPTDALFALDPNYLAAQGEDYHSFRALAERSQLADNIKDPAVVTQVPELGPAWQRQSEAVAGWTNFRAADFQRLNREFGVTWVLVGVSAEAGLACPWHNGTLAVCRLR